MDGARSRSLHMIFSLMIIALLLMASSSVASKKKTVGIYELKRGDFSVKITNWGATVLSVILPDSRGNLADVVLGYEGLRPYFNETTYFGALLGRVAGEISQARFTLNGTVYRLYPNDPPNTLHGGRRGFSFVIWSLVETGDGEFPYIKLYYYSFDNEEGFPGDVDVYVTYMISGDYELSVTMEATPRTRSTPVSLGLHSYWNLGGHNSGTILSNVVQIFASRYTPDGNGTISTVAGTPLDFRTPQTVGSRISQLKEGYNHNYVVDGHGMRKVAAVKDEKTGRAMELWANQPAMVFYTSFYLENEQGKGGAVYGRYAALCLETGGFEDAVNHPEFPSVIVNPGELYRHEMLHKFSF